MADFLGNIAEIDMYAADGTTVAASLQCALKEELGIEFSTDEEETTPLCKTEFEGLPTTRKGTLSFSVKHDNGTYSNSVQKKVEDVYFSNATRLFKFRIQGTGVGKPEWSFNAYFTKHAPIVSNKAPVATECELTISGAVTRLTQA